MTQLANATTVELEVTREKAIELRIAGLTYREIGATLEISKSRAHELVMEGLAEQRELNASKIAELVELECSRAESVIEALWDLRGKPRYSAQILHASRRISELRGLDAPKRSELSGPGGAPLVPPGAIAITLVAPPDSPNVAGG